MKRYIKSSTGYNVSWYTQDGRQSGAYVEVPDDVTDEYNYIEHHLRNKYKEDFGGVADYIPEYDAIGASSVTTMTEEEMLDDAILNGRPFDIDTFSKYKVDPYRVKGAVKAGELKVGDIIQVTEDAAEIDCPSPEIEIMDIRYDDPDEYGHDCITFYCYDNETGDEYTLHFWPDEWVGPIIARKSAYSVTSATHTNISIEWGEPYRPYAGSEHTYYTLYVNNNEVGYVDAWSSDGDWGYTAYLKASDTQYKESIGTFRSLDTAKHRLESLVNNTQDLIDNFPVTSSETITSDSSEDEYEWSPFENHDYLVVAGPYSDVTFLCDDPKRAVAYWFKYQKKYPMDVSISCPTRELAIKLVKAGTSNYLTTLYDKYPDCPYKLDYLIEECKRKVADGCKGFYENDYGYGDTVHPFTVG